MVPARIPTTSELVSRLGIPAEQLAALVADPAANYHAVRIPRGAESFRTLLVPDDTLKKVQRILLHRVLPRLDGHPANHCQRKRSVITNAKMHWRHAHVAAYDIDNCFPSVVPSMVTMALVRFGLPHDVAEVVTRLCTVRRELPQGAPTSPALLSAVLLPLDVKLTAEAERQGLTYTRYMDDLFLSGNRHFSRFERVAMTNVKQAGFRLACEKARRWGPGHRATLAGVVLGTKLSPTPEFAREVRILVNDVRRGALPDNTTTRAFVEGKISWVRALSPRRGRELLALLNRPAA